MFGGRGDIPLGLRKFFDRFLPSQPVWSGPIRAGQELLTQRLMISGVSGQDLLHVVLEPTQVEGVSASTGGASAAAAPATLYVDGEGSFEFERTVSRLMEMQSPEYLALEHIA